VHSITNGISVDAAIFDYTNKSHTKL